jgi:hypothetical protein
MTGKANLIGSTGAKNASAVVRGATPYANQLRAKSFLGLTTNAISLTTPNGPSRQKVTTASAAAVS